LKEQKTFEQAMERLEAIVAALDGGELPLEQSLELFSEGAGLVSHCQSVLENAKLKVETLFPEERQEQPEDE